MLAHCNGMQMIFDSLNSLFDIILSITHYNTYSTYLSLLLIIVTLDPRVSMAHALFKHSLIVGYLGCLQCLSTINMPWGHLAFLPFTWKCLFTQVSPRLEIVEANAGYCVPGRLVSCSDVQRLLVSS